MAHRYLRRTDTSGAPPTSSADLIGHACCGCEVLCVALLCIEVPCVVVLCVVVLGVMVVGVMVCEALLCEALLESDGVNTRSETARDEAHARKVALLGLCRDVGLILWRQQSERDLFPRTVLCVFYVVVPPPTRSTSSAERPREA